jgi:hypothetical protein
VGAQERPCLQVKGALRFLSNQPMHLRLALALRERS